MSFSPLVDELIKALRCLPGVGPKSAQRMAFHLLQRERDRGRILATILVEALEKVGHCKSCRTLCEHELCKLCDSPIRDISQICVVETPADVLAVEQTGSFKGRYFVLMGHLSPIDGIGPEDIGIELFLQRLASADIKEVILATNPTVEGEATSAYLSQQLKRVGVKVTRIAMGIPVGSDIEYTDEITMLKAMEGRREL